VTGATVVTIAIDDNVTLLRSVALLLVEKTPPYRKL